LDQIARHPLEDSAANPARVPWRTPAAGESLFCARITFGMAQIVSIGEILWDVFPDSETLGGAPFNFSVHASRLGHEVTFISAVGDDERGRTALARAGELGLGTDFIGTVPGIATGTVSVRLDSAGQPDFTIHRPAAYDAVQLDAADLKRLAATDPGWLYYGTLHQTEAEARAETKKLAESLPAARRFYDINLRPHSYTREVVEELMATADVVKLNDDEAAGVDSMFGRPHGSLSEFTEFWSRQFGWMAAAVTRGPRGCAIRIGAEYAEPHGYAVTVADTVGAGDAFAAAFLHGLSQGWDAGHAGDFANRLGAVVASRAGGVPLWRMEDCDRLI
jgi:fructokinase